jgi:hypothetical protein
MGKPADYLGMQVDVRVTVPEVPSRDSQLAAAAN